MCKLIAWRRVELHAIGSFVLSFADSRLSDQLKAQVGERAAAMVEDGMRLGIGTGSTAEAFIHALAARVEDGLNIIGVPTSVRTETLCKKLGIPLTTLEESPHLDLTIDGADEIDPHLNLIKGAGGALLREKIVAAASNDMLVIADGSKVVDTLGAFALPIEINAFGQRATMMALERVGAEFSMQGGLSLRMDAKKASYVTDGGHLIVDASFGRIDDPTALYDALLRIPGVVEHGLFTGLASRAIVARETGIELLEPV
ncbi:MAG: ribose-5-phosphate isomerase RpiA [Ahrensia sp.]|nr:ribose-5-phosphate isomerase RpiA [Ahrensia sp.]